MLNDEARSAAEAQAKEYLGAQLRDRAPSALRFVRLFDERPLEGEGAVALFAFELAPGATGPCGAADTQHYVFAGQTEPNFYPSFGLPPEDVYSLHVGTRFMLTVGVEKLNCAAEPAHFREHMQQFVRGCNPGAAVANEECVLLFRCDDQQHAVYQMDINNLPVYYVGGDLPPGFYQMTEHPPQVALRLHLGNLIRAEKGGD